VVFRAPAAADEARRQPAEEDAPEIGDDIDDEERNSDLLEVELRRERRVVVEERGQPGEVEPPDRVRHELRNRERPGFAELKQVTP
jgi:hypothetical protein